MGPRVQNIDKETVDIFAATSGLQHERNDCCTVSHFQIDILNGPRSPWNRSAARVFTIDFAHFHDLDLNGALLDDIERAFYTRVKTLRADYLKSLRPKISIEHNSQKDRRWQRKRGVSCLFKLTSISIDEDSFSCADYLSRRNISLWRNTYAFLSTSEWMACQAMNPKTNVKRRAPPLSNTGPPTMLRCPPGGRSLPRGGFTLLMGFIWLAAAFAGQGEHFLEGASTVKTRSASRPKSLTVSQQMFMMTCGLKHSGKWKTIYSPCAQLM